MGSAPANPCGIIAYSIFNDSYTITFNGNALTSLTTDGIAWPSDLQKYKISDASLQWYNVTDPRFMNWMRIASLPNFRKLWARINQDLPVGQYTIQITNCKVWGYLDYDVSGFGAEKYFVLSTSSVFGSKNLFLSVMYLVMGFLCLIVGALFLGRKLNKRKSVWWFLWWELEISLRRNCIIFWHLWCCWETDSLTLEFSSITVQFALDVLTLTTRNLQ